MKSVAFHTLGCKLNFAETSTLARQFKDAGWNRVDYPGAADIFVINTCSVTENADRECRQIVNRAMTSNPEGKVIIVGCFAQLKPEAISQIPGVSLVLGASEKFNILHYLNRLQENASAEIAACEISEVHEFVSAHSSGDRTRVFLKVQDGCDYSCSFCTIPLARGASRSDTIANAVLKATEIAAEGVKEIVLTGVNLGDFGIRDPTGKHQDKFIDLIQALDEVEGIERFRISSIEPNLLTDEVIRFVAQSQKFVPHFHIPLQSGSDEILKAMRRRYKRELYSERIATIKNLIPHCGIGVDVIVGFPGETEEHFLETYNYLQELDISYLHVFTYSERPNTLAAEMKTIIPISVRKQRNSMLRNLSQKKLRAFYQADAGNIRPVLFEAEMDGGVMYGYTSNYIRVAHPYSEHLINQVVQCKIEKINPEGYAEVVLSQEELLINS
ncbi:tRNA (N(6)-L-threonylcarbamoyladenosine(37)-C(2))-methylthiotransferase MtaB [soil metagenome]